MQKLIAQVQFMWKGYRNFGKSGFDSAAQTWNDLDLNYDVSGRCYVITGANSGIGKEAALGIAKRGGQVHMLCRNEERGNEAKKEIIEKTNSDTVYLHVVDVSEPESITKFVNEWYQEDKPIYCLINNAGVLLDSKQKNSQDFEVTFATNLQGTFILTELLLPALIKGGTKEEPSRVITVSSGGMYTKRLELENMEYYPREKFDGVDAYANTKRAQVYLSEIWSKKISPKYPVNFYSMHPGWAGTPGVEKSLPTFFEKLEDKLRSPAEGADTVVWLGCTPEKSIKNETGLFYFDRAPAETHYTWSGTQSTDEEIAALWDKLVAFKKLGIGNQLSKETESALSSMKEQAE